MGQSGSALESDKINSKKEVLLLKQYRVAVFVDYGEHELGKAE